MNLKSFVKILQVNEVPYKILALPNGLHRVILSKEYIAYASDMNYFIVDSSIAVDLTF